MSDSEHARRSGEKKAPVAAEEDPQALPRGRALFGAERFEAVKREREEASESIARSLKAWRSAKGEAKGTPKIPEGAGGKLPDGLRGKMEDKLGADLSGVKIHTGGDSASAAEALGARAFTVGSDVHFGAGQFAPGSKEGDRLIAHELTHVVQGQEAGIQRKAESEAEPGQAPEVSQPHEAAEVEADQTADHVADSLHGDSDKGHEKKPAAPKAAAPNVGAKLWLKKDPKPTADQKRKAEDIKKFAAQKSAEIKGKWSKISAGVTGALAVGGTIAAVAHGLPAEVHHAAPLIASIAGFIANKLGFMKQRHHAVEEKAQIFSDIDALLMRPELVEQVYQYVKEMDPELKELEEKVAELRKELTRHEEKRAQHKADKKARKGKDKPKKHDKAEVSHEVGDKAEKAEVGAEVAEHAEALHALEGPLTTVATMGKVVAPVAHVALAAFDELAVRKTSAEFKETKLHEDQQAAAAKSPAPASAAPAPAAADGKDSKKKK